MTLQEFKDKYLGIGNVGNTTENKGECVGLVMVWLKNLGLPHIWGHAFSLLVNADRNFYNVVENTPTNIPLPGDVIVWKKGFNGTYGHTAIVTKATVNTVEVLEQNNPLGAPCRLKTYNYSYVDGWLTPKKTVQPHICPTLSFNDQTHILIGISPLGTDFGTMEIGAARSTIFDQEKKIKDLEANKSVVTCTVNDGIPPEEKLEDFYITLFKWIVSKFKK